jgi:hypothetical protein
MNKNIGIKLLLIIIGALSGAVSNALMEINIAEETEENFDSN